tara:strand:- start:939 stop:1451 length:513 start_codon:yes stop_codon:yes gene_type:complete
MTSTLKTDKIEGVTSSGTVQMPAGHVVQMQTAQLSGASTSYTGTSYADTGLTVNITPKFATSKIFVLVTQQIGINVSGANDQARMDTRLIENGSSTVISATFFEGTDTQVTGSLSVTHSQHGLFQCSSTNQLTFKNQARPASGSANSASQLALSWYTNSVHNITAMEIAQ